MNPDLFDISHHNTITDWDAVPHIPIVHKVNEGRTLDGQFRARMPTIAGRTELFGGYVVLIVAQSTIAQQIETYARAMEPFWRDGAFTQLDVEPWTAYARPVNCDEILEAAHHHDRLLGVDRCTVYINPNQMPTTFRQWYTDNAGRRPLWIPNYSLHGAQQVQRWGAALHQYTSLHKAPGFTRPIDANWIYDPAAVARVANLDQPATPPPDPQEADDMLILVNDTELHAVFTLDGVPISPEVLDAIRANNVPHLMVDQNHPYWRAAMSNRIGALAGFRYGQLYAEQATT